MRKKVSFTLIFILVIIIIIAVIVGWKGITKAPVSGEGITNLPEPSYWPTNEWETATPESQGFHSVKLAEGLKAIKEKSINVHSLMIIRDGSIILDAYFYPYDGSTYHEVASVTKSVMTTLIGIAADQGKLDLDQPILSFFPERTIANKDSMKEQITVRHLVSNSSGFRFNEKDDEVNLDAMRGSDDWMQAALDPPVIHKPGTHFAYYSPGMHLLSAILQKATGMTALEFADTYLFKPLGIKEFYWPSDPQGYTRGWGDLCLYPEDMAKIGFLFLHQGKWEGKQIISSQWVNEATRKQLPTGQEREGYGYGWWISSPYPDEEIPFYRALGRNQQLIIVYPSINALLITTGGGFDFDEIAPYIVASIGDLENPLPENPSAVEELNHTVSELKQLPESQAVPPLPEIASSISGKTFIFEPNALDLESFSFDFDNEKEAMLQLKMTTESIPRKGFIGLDGLWRLSVSGYPAVSRGYWEDDKTFILEYSDIIDYREGPGLNNYSFRLYFENNKVILEILTPAPAAGLTIEGKSN
jgi:CubicO group peptidase (beta-lactamase class C family)